jgi:hypothetical protein
MKSLAAYTGPEPRYPPYLNASAGAGEHYGRVVVTLRGSPGDGVADVGPTVVITMPTSSFRAFLMDALAGLEPND